MKIFNWLATLILLATVPLSAILPRTLGFEGGLVETLQLAALEFGAIFALYCARQAIAPQGWFWSAGLALWGVLIGRELSWGAVFMAPYAVTEEGPQFSSSQLWYKAAVDPILFVVLVFVIFALWKGAMGQVFKHAWREKSLPLRELALVVLAMVLAAAGEGNLVSGLVFSNGQLVDELAELAAYGFLIAAQMRFASGLRSNEAFTAIERR